MFDSYNQEDVKTLKTAIDLKEAVLLVGHTGVGKTHLISLCAEEKNKVLHRISFHSGIGADEIIGKWLAKDGSTIWEDGLLIKAMKNGDWVVFDELNACPADVLFLIHSLLDDDRKITLVEKNSEVIKPHDEFRIFGTMNPITDYAGTKELNMAFLSRFIAVIEVNPLEASLEIKLLMDRTGIKEKDAQVIVGKGCELRQKKQQEDIVYFCGTRDLLSVAKLVKNGIETKEAFRVAIFNKMSEDDKETLNVKNNITLTNPFKKEIDEEKKKAKKLENDLKLEQEKTSKLEQESKQFREGLEALPKDVKNALKMLGLIQDNTIETATDKVNEELVNF